jgi:hypothetical protein
LRGWRCGPPVFYCGTIRLGLPRLFCLLLVAGFRCLGFQVCRGGSGLGVILLRGLGVSDWGLVRLGLGDRGDALAAQFCGQAVGFGAGVGELGGPGERGAQGGAGALDLCLGVGDFLSLGIGRVV